MGGWGTGLGWGRGPGLPRCALGSNPRDRTARARGWGHGTRARGVGHPRALRVVAFKMLMLMLMLYTNYCYRDPCWPAKKRVSSNMALFP